jgi:hypothetical protein
MVVVVRGLKLVDWINSKAKCQKSISHRNFECQQEIADGKEKWNERILPSLIKKTMGVFYGSSNDTTTNTRHHTLVRVTISVQVLKNGRESKIHPTGGECGRGSTQQPTKPDTVSLFF